MFVLFLLMAAIVGGLYFGKRTFSMVTLLVTLGLCSLILWHHMTNPLQISW